MDQDLNDMASPTQNSPSTMSQNSNQNKPVANENPNTMVCKLKQMFKRQKSCIVILLYSS